MKPSMSAEAPEAVLEAHANAAEQKLLDDVDELERRGRRVERIVIRSSPIPILLATAVAFALGSGLFSLGKRYAKRRRRRTFVRRIARALGIA